MAYTACHAPLEVHLRLRYKYVTIAAVELPTKKFLFSQTNTYSGVLNLSLISRLYMQLGKKGF